MAEYRLETVPSDDLNEFALVESPSGEVWVLVAFGVDWMLPDVKERVATAMLAAAVAALSLEDKKDA